MMNKARRILSGGWLGDALSVFTRGWWTRETGVTHAVSADVECRFVALGVVETRLSALSDAVLRSTTPSGDVRTIIMPIADVSMRFVTSTVDVEL